MAGKREALIVIDMQKGFDKPSWGTRNNPRAEANGLVVLQAWRATGRQVIIVRHDSTNPDSPLRPGQPGNDLKPGFEPVAGDWLIAKSVNSAFIATDLKAQLHNAGITAITVFGLTTDQCVSTTVRMAANFGFAVTVVEDACACFAQTAPWGQPVSADLLHMAHITTLNTEFARVVTSHDAFCH